MRDPPIDKYFDIWESPASTRFWPNVPIRSVSDLSTNMSWPSYIHINSDELSGARVYATIDGNHSPRVTL